MAQGRPDMPGTPETGATQDARSDVVSSLEAILMVIDEPAAVVDLAAALAVPEPEVDAALDKLQREYDGYTDQDAVGKPTGTPRGFELRSLAGGWRIFSRRDFAPVVSKFVLAGQTSRLSQAALETLAVIAYRQPVSRSRVAAIRGVNVDSVVRTLVLRGLIEDCGPEPETGSLRFRTTSYFLERLGLEGLVDLPRIAPHLPGLENLGDFENPVY